MKKFVFGYMLLKFLVNMHGLSLEEMKKTLQLLMLFKKYRMNLITNQTKYAYKGSELFNWLIKSFLQNNNLEIHSVHNEGIFVAAERFIKTLKNEIHKYLTLISKDVYIDKLDGIANKYNNIFHKAN